MKRDENLIRKILLIMNGSGGELTDLKERLHVIDYTYEQVGYHCYLLQNAGLIEGIELKEFGYGQMWIPISLTSAGHDLAEEISSPNDWKKKIKKVFDKTNININLFSSHRPVFIYFSFNVDSYCLL